jgi:hypothetical protein
VSSTPIYQHIEFVSAPDRLWGKVESKWDWLGIKPDGTFVVGYPKRSGGPGISVEGATAVSDNATIGEHGVRVRVPNSGGSNKHWFPTAASAREHYEGVISETINADAPGLLMRVDLIEFGEVIEHEFIVRRKSTYRGG